MARAPSLRLAIAAGYRIADARLAKRAPTLFARIGFALAYRFVLRNIRLMIGIDRSGGCSPGQRRSHRT